MKLVDVIADGIRVLRTRDGFEIPDATIRERAKNIAQAVLYLPRTEVVNAAEESYDVYIGRAGHGEVGTFGNPVVPDRPCPVCSQVHRSPGSTLPCWRRHFYDRVYSDSRFWMQVAKLKGRRLGCPGNCKPGPCHGDTIVTWLEGVDLR